MFKFCLFLYEKKGRRIVLLKEVGINYHHYALIGIQGWKKNHIRPWVNKSTYDYIS